MIHVSLFFYQLHNINFFINSNLHFTTERLNSLLLQRTLLLNNSFPSAQTSICVVKFSEQRMNKFPTYPKYEAGDYCGYDFDPHTDFMDFLSEARKHVSEGKFDATPSRSVELRINNSGKNVKKTCKKSWKSSLFSWMKTDKKKTQGIRETSKLCTINKPRRGCVSGPMQGISGPGAIAGKPNKPLSGPLTSLFSPMNRLENEMPYLCLKKVKDSTPDLPSYGPVYLVT